MNELAKKYPDFVQVKRIGRSHEKRSILVLRVSKPHNLSSLGYLTVDSNFWLNIDDSQTE
jgi:hypothetical protein